MAVLTKAWCDYWWLLSCDVGGGKHQDLSLVLLEILRLFGQSSPTFVQKRDTQPSNTLQVSDTCRNSAKGSRVLIISGLTRRKTHCNELRMAKHC